MPNLDNTASGQIAYTWLGSRLQRLLGDKLSLAVDVYTFEEGFIEFTGVGPTYALVGGNIFGTLCKLELT